MKRRRLRKSGIAGSSSKSRPDYAVPPSEAEFARWCGGPTKFISEIIPGKAPIEPKTALWFAKIWALRRVFGSALRQSTAFAKRRARTMRWATTSRFVSAGRTSDCMKSQPQPDGRKKETPLAERRVDDAIADVVGRTVAQWKGYWNRLIDARVEQETGYWVSPQSVIAYCRRLQSLSQIRDTVGKPMASYCAAP